MNDLEQTNMLQPLVDEIETAVSNAKKEIAEKVNSVITETYWKIGKYIVEFEQDGNVKAAYGSKLLTTLSHQLTLRLGRGYSRPNLNNMRKFYLCYENCQTVSDKLTWSHICELIKIDDELERSFYEKECYKEKWDVRTLRRQMDSALFLRLATSRDKEGILALAREGITYDKPEDVIKDTYTLEFLGLPEKERYSEEDLEQKIIDNLQKFLLELGKGFTELPDIADELGYTIADYDYAEMPQVSDGQWTVIIKAEYSSYGGLRFTSNDNGKTWMYEGLSTGEGDLQ